MFKECKLLFSDSSGNVKLSESSARGLSKTGERDRETLDGVEKLKLLVRNQGVYNLRTGLVRQDDERW